MEAAGSLSRHASSNSSLNSIWIELLLAACSNSCLISIWIELFLAALGLSALSFLLSGQCQRQESVGGGHTRSTLSY